MRAGVLDFRSNVTVSPHVFEEIRSVLPLLRSNQVVVISGFMAIFHAARVQRLRHQISK